jgi:hypothetical protein
METKLEEIDDAEIDKMIEDMKNKGSGRKRSILGDDLTDSIAKM